MSNNNPDKQSPSQTGKLSPDEFSEVARYSDPFTGISDDTGTPRSYYVPKSKHLDEYTPNIMDYSEIAAHDTEVTAEYKTVNASNAGKAGKALFDLNQEEEPLGQFDSDGYFYSPKLHAPTQDQRNAFNIEADNYNNLATKLNHFYSQENPNNFHLNTGHINSDENAEIANWDDPYTEISDLPTHDANVVANNYATVNASNAGKASEALFELGEAEDGISKVPNPSKISQDQRNAFNIEANNYNNLATKLNHFYNQENPNNFHLNTGHISNDENAEIAKWDDPYTGISDGLEPHPHDMDSNAYTKEPGMEHIRSYTSIATHDANVVANNYSTVNASNAGRANKALFDLNQEEETLTREGEKYYHPSPDERQALEIEEKQLQQPCNQT